MNIPYRTRYALKQAAIVTFVVILVAALAFLCWFTWLKRYIVYTDEGAQLDMELSAQVSAGEAAVPPEQNPPINIYYNEGENAINTSKELVQITGYYANTADLQEGVSTVWAQAKALPTGTPVMIDVKDGKGRFFYSSSLSEHRNSKIDIATMDEMIRDLDRRGTYLIAKLPAFRDYQFGLNNTSCGLAVKSGGYLWADAD